MESILRVVVVGGGISGSLAALNSAKAGHEVTILEGSRNLGGALRDHELSDGTWYRNCQYIIPERWHMTS